MIKKIFSALVVVLMATSVMAQSGFTCNDPIPVDSNYQAQIGGPCEVWYTAHTYDLPLHVYFLPDAENSTWGPEVYVDFTCTPGVYEDQNITNLVNSMTDFGYDLPIELMCDQVIREGKKAYDLNIGKFYRDQLTEFGINYNVQAFVKVTFFESGRISLRPDSTFKNCMEQAHYIELGDTMQIASNDSESVFVAALPDWKKDSIRFVWDGVEPLRMFFATSECNFNPTTTNDYVYKYFDVVAGTPLKMYPNQMEVDIDNSKDGGIFFVKMLSNSGGNLVVEKIPLAPPAGGAELLEYDQTVKVLSDNQIYAFSKTWSEATSFVASGDFEMQVSNSHLFDTSLSGVFVNSYASSVVEGNKAVGLTSAEMTAIVEKALDRFLYVRFVATGAISVTPKVWNISGCLDNTIALQANTPIVVSPSTIDNVYRFVYADYSGYDLKIKWEGSGSMFTYVGDACDFSTSSPLYEKIFTRKTTTTVKADVVNSWASSVDEDGYLYVRFENTGRANSVTFITEKPEPSTSPCVLGSTELKLNSVVALNLASVHTIYRINYAEWQAAGATLAWEGTSPLHTFLAGTCTFPVAPHNRYVLDYEAVLPAGEKVMAADWLARMAQYVDEDGYLYIRFLTEFEGTLRVNFAFGN